ncbi:UBX domain-containing protein 4-like, partial [Saccoglossus kowalevskii]|uniref:UBX domain-containing protein 4-like n=1 Tax=Saccoglossus kowalevskii TaxID=10224 RepID=A0ABM0MNE8_SACKO
MHWFEGDISSAIAKAKQTKAVFVIFIKGEDELSKQMCETWEDTSVSTLCQQEKMVTMQLQANSESCRQFSQIYPVFCVPATFFIGTNGVPLEVVGGHLSSQEFTVKINKVIE